VLDLTGKAAAAFLVLVSLVLFLPGLFALPPVDRDESRYAQASKQMVESGNYVDIRFQEEPRHKKPIGIYWLQSAAANLFDDAEAPRVWAYRIPSLIGGIIAVLLTWAAGSRLFNPRAGLMAGLMMAGCLMLGYEARQAKTDAVLLATILGAQTGLAFAWMNWKDGKQTSAWLAYGFWVAVGLAALVKGPIVLIVSGGTVLLLCFRQKSRGWLKTLRPATGFPLALAIIVPWFIAIALESQGAFFKESVGHDLFKKIYSGQESHGAPPGYYFLTFWASFWPFALLAGLAARLVWRHRKNPAVAFCIAWILPTWILFELIVTKLPHYMLPLFPAAAILAAGMITDAEKWNAGKRGVFEWIAIALTAIVTIAIAGVVIAGATATGDEFSLWSIVALAGVLWAGLSLFRIARDRALAATLIPQLVLAAVIVTGAGFKGFLPSLQSIWLSPRVAEVVQTYQAETCKDAKLHAVGYREPSLIFLAGTDTVLTNPADAAKALKAGPDCAVAMIGDRDIEAFSKTAGEIGLTPRQLAELPGFNYSRGQKITLRVFAGR